MTPTLEQLRAIAQAGVLAPSADNRHVFQIEIGDAWLRLWPTPEFASCNERHRRVLGLISLGAVTENMRLQAGAMGWLAEVSWKSGAGDPIAELRLRPASDAAGEDLAPAIPLRQTNRKMYKGPALGRSEEAELGRAVGAVPGVELHWPRGAARREVLGMIWRAESERFLRPRLHEELFSSIRFDADWRTSTDESLAPGSLEVEAPMRPMFKALRHWPLMRGLNWIGSHRMLGLRAGWLPCWQAPALGVLSVPADALEAAPQVGAAFQRLWLRATLQGLALQPMASPAVLGLQSDEDQGASPALRARLAAGWARVVPGRVPLMLFRLGRAPRAEVVSGRRRLEDYLARPR